MVQGIHKKSSIVKKSTHRFISIPVLDENAKKNPAVLRVILSKDFTQIDFGHVAPWIYTRGGWIRIAPYSYIQVVGMDKKYKLLDAVNIPISPDKHDYESTQDWQVFSLIFEPIPLKEYSINIIEEENPNERDFNYMNVKLENLIQLVE